MKNEQKNQRFWNRYAKIYDVEINALNKNGYSELYRLISARLTKDMRVLEIATGTGLVALQVAAYAHSIEATDYAPKMIAAAKKKDVPANVHFSVEDATALSFAPQTFDAIIISNALHIVPNPALVLENIRRVLKPGGLLIAPTFSMAHLKGKKGGVSARILKMLGFETYDECTIWSPAEFVTFINSNGFAVNNWRVLQAAFPLVYLEATLL